MRQWLRMVGTAIATGIGGVILWWTIDRIYTINNVGLLARQVWPLNDVYAVGAIAAALGVIQSLFISAQQRRHAREVKEVAGQLGLSYEETVPSAPVKDFPLFAGWSGGQNRMTGRREGFPVEILDFTAVVGSGEDATRTTRTVALLPGEGLPAFDLRSRQLTQRILGAIGMPGVTFDHRAAAPADAAAVREFGQKFHLTVSGPGVEVQPEEESTLRQLFGPRLMGALARYPGYSVRSHGGCLAVWKGDQIRPAPLRGKLLEDALAIRAALVQADASAPQTVLPPPAGHEPEQQNRKLVATTLGALAGGFVGFVGGSAGSAAVFFSQVHESTAVAFFLTPPIFFGGVIGGAVLGGLIGSRFRLPRVKPQEMTPEAVRRRDSRQAAAGVGGAVGLFAGFCLTGALLFALASTGVMPQLPFWLFPTLFFSLILGGIVLGCFVGHGVARRWQESSARRQTFRDGPPEDTRPVAAPARQAGGNAFIGTCFLIFGVLFLVIGGGWGYHSYSFGRGALRTEGVVLRLKESTDSEGGKNYLPVVRYAVGGKPFEIEGRLASSPPAYSVGEKVTVLYHANEPGTGHIDSFSDRWLMPAVFGGGGLAFAAFGWLLARRRTPDATTVSREPVPHGSA